MTDSASLSGEQFTGRRIELSSYRQFPGFEETVVDRITRRLGAVPSTEQLLAWENREWPDTFFRPKIVDGEFETLYHASLGSLTLRAFRDPVGSLKSSQKDGFPLAKLGSKVSRAQLEQLCLEGLFVGYQYVLDSSSFNYPSQQITGRVWYKPASFSRDADGVSFEGSSKAAPHITRINTAPKFFDPEANEEILRESRKRAKKGNAAADPTGPQSSSRMRKRGIKIWQ